MAFTETIYPEVVYGSVDMVCGFLFTYKGQPCRILAQPVFRKGVRQVLIELDTRECKVVLGRYLRRATE